MSRKSTQNRRLENIAKLVNEIAEDNTSLVGVINRVLEGHSALRIDLIREIGRLREDLAGVFTYHTLKDICNELIPLIAAMEAMLHQADFTDTRAIRGHVESLVITLYSVLSRMGAEKITISPGEDVFDAKRHQCIRLLTPEESPFPRVPPRTVVRIVEDGYTFADRILLPARVEVQAEEPNNCSE
ncbi:MAG: nucleotide exchange factor GrpE [Planctomycetes bacterium]|nr:nucleotide exchange factor GrpE [Planctomycetota bacterium]